MKKMGILPILLLILGGVIIVNGMTRQTGRKPLDLFRRRTPEEKALSLRSQMAVALEAGDDPKYLKLQKELEMVELETGL